LILDPRDPLPSARTFTERSYFIQDTLALRHQGGVFYAYDPERKAYAERDEATIRAELYGFLESAQWWAKPKANHPSALGPFKPTKSRVENVADALRALCNLPTACAPPCWLQPNPALDPLDILACRNGLLHIPTRTLSPGTPAFYSLTGLDFAFDPHPPKPARWEQFLAELWPDDPESRDTLQEVFGYCLTPRTHLQKIFMVVGPMRSGKGTIGRVLRRLLGERNVCGPTLANMSEPFGLSILIGKSLAIIADARISGRTDTAVVTERLLSISGEDPLSVPRKYLPVWTGKLSSRFLLLTNELPRIEDASGALASRFIILTLSQSFYGREDHGLFERLLPELPGILNWALEGWDRLIARGRFVQPASSSELLQQFEDLGSPVGAFIRDRCDIGAAYEVEQAVLFDAWKSWAEANGRERSGTTQTFGRNLRAAYPWLKNTRPLVAGERVRTWRGIRLREAG
jgi:putative DNA primase/helicase